MFLHNNNSEKKPSYAYIAQELREILINLVHCVSSLLSRQASGIPGVKEKKKKGDRHEKRDAPGQKGKPDKKSEDGFCYR